MRQRELDGEEHRGGERGELERPLVRGTTATTPARTIVPTWTTVCSDARSGIPAAWYWPHPQTENGESRPSWKPSVRFQNVSNAVQSEGSRRRIENASAVVTPKAAAKRTTDTGRSPERYVSQSGAIRSAANFAQPASAVAAPRAVGEEASQNPQTRNAASARRSCSRGGRRS